MKSSIAGALSALGALSPYPAAAVPGEPLRNILYFDQWHTAVLPPKNVTAGVTHVITAFAQSDIFVPETAAAYEPFMPLDEVRALFDEGTQLGIAIGGWGDNAGFDVGAKDDTSRAAWAQNVASMVAEHGFDFVDIDWEYPAGNGADYKQVTNEEKAWQIEAYPLFLKAIKEAITPKPLTLAVPGLERDMIAFNSQSASSIWESVDFVNIMTYDLMNRRDTETLHHSGTLNSLAAIDRYLALGLPASKINLGFAFYAKYFETPEDSTCSAERAVGCPIVKAENDDGSDAGTSGTVTFEVANLSPSPAPANLTASPDSSCGVGTTFACTGSGESICCSQYGWCGNSDAHCGAGCQADYGTCEGPDVTASFAKAMAEGKLDEAEGAMWYWDSEARLFWTWDTAELIDRKFSEIVQARGLGGVMAWSLSEDSADWSRIRAMTEGVKKINDLSARAVRQYPVRPMGRHSPWGF